MVSQELCVGNRVFVGEKHPPFGLESYFLTALSAVDHAFVAQVSGVFCEFVDWDSELRRQLAYVVPGPVFQGSEESLAAQWESPQRSWAFPGI